MTARAFCESLGLVAIVAGFFTAAFVFGWSLA